MTENRDGRAFAVAVWILLAAVAVTATAGVVGGILSTSLVPDLIALWPLLVVASLIGLLGRWLARRAGRRSRALLPLTLFSAVVLAASLHLGGWEALPSAEARLTGPPATGLSVPAELIVQVSGEIHVKPSRAGDAAYRVEPIPRGGRVGVPQATETSVDGNMSIVLAATSDSPDWYRYAGWELTLSPEVPWRLVLNGELAADLTSFDLASATLAGSGTVRLGSPPSGGASVIVAGNIDVVVPPGAAVVVHGAASVPPTWETTAGGARSPAAGEGEGDNWSVSVQGDVAVTVVEE